MYALLADGGEIFMKMEQTPFANRFAMLRDKFGTSRTLLHQPEHPFLSSLFPTLDHELNAVHQRDVSWSIWTALEQEIKQAQDASGPPGRL